MSNTQFSCRNFKIFGKAVFVFVTLLFLGHFLHRYITKKNSETIRSLLRKEAVQEYTLALFNSMKEQFIAKILSEVKEEIILSRRKRDQYFFNNRINCNNHEDDSNYITPRNPLSTSTNKYYFSGEHIQPRSPNGVSGSHLPCICPNVTRIRRKLGVLKGKPGLPGLKGETGKKGDQGIPGEPGLKGKKGLKGYLGPSGYLGYKGIPGTPGPVEPGLQKPVKPGNAGLPGSPGDPGLDGKPGVPGMPGKKGPQGPPGPKGARGEPGVIPHLEIHRNASGLLNYVSLRRELFRPGAVEPFSGSDD